MPSTLHIVPCFYLLNMHVSIMTSVVTSHLITLFQQDVASSVKWVNVVLVGHKWPHPMQITTWITTPTTQHGGSHAETYTLMERDDFPSMYIHKNYCPCMQGRGRRWWRKRRRWWSLLSLERAFGEHPFYLVLWLTLGQVVGLICDHSTELTNVVMEAGMTVFRHLALYIL